MSKNEKVTEEKVVTKYDLKMQKREEQKKSDKREKRRSTIIGVLITVALVGFVASFPIRAYMAMNGTYLTVGGEDVSRVEYDYNYNVVVNNYMNTYGSYMSYFGLDMYGDLSTQMYSDTLTWKDYFDQMTVDKLKQSKALKAEVEAAGFTYDTSEEYATFEENIKTAATENGLTVKDYVQQAYGAYATLNRISKYVENDFITAAYYDQKAEEFAPSDEEIQAYYESNSINYDSVDYRVINVSADVPEEASEDEITQAMDLAEVEANLAVATVATEGELQENVTISATNYLISEWLFSDERKEGDTTVITDNDTYQYYVLAFERRYLNDSPTVDARIVTTDVDDVNAILDEWKSGEATEESFGEICKKYSTDYFAADGGLQQGIANSNLPEGVSAWLFDAARAAGDTVAITTEDMSYVLYYVGQNEPEWKLSIESTLTETNMSDYVTEITEGIEVEDPKGNFNYLKVEAEAETAGTETAETESGTESTEAE